MIVLKWNKEHQVVPRLLQKAKQVIVSLTTERSHSRATSQNAQPRVVALRTVPVFLKNGNRRIKGTRCLTKLQQKRIF